MDIWTEKGNDNNGEYAFTWSGWISLLPVTANNMLDYLPDMQAGGISSLKIEGRMKTEYYVAAITRVYRTALDLLAESEEAYRTA